MGYIFAVLCGLSYTVLGLTYKLSGQKRCNFAQTDFYFFLTSVVGSALLVLFFQRELPPIEAVYIGISAGLTGTIAVKTFRSASAHGNISTNWMAISLSIVVPIIASIALWNERPTPMHWAGFIFTIIAIICIGIDMGKRKP